MTQIKPTYVTFEQAKKLKEKEFNVPTQWAFDLKGQDYKDEHWDIDYNCCTYNCYSKPEQWQVVEWLRVNRGINILPIESYTYPDEIKNRWKYQIINKQEKNKDIFNKKFFIESDYEFQSPQESYSAAFDYILNNLI